MAVLSQKLTSHVNFGVLKRKFFNIDNVNTLYYSCISLSNKIPQCCLLLILYEYITMFFVLRECKLIPMGNIHFNQGLIKLLLV